MREEKNNEQALRFTRAAKRRWTEFLAGHERGDPRKLLLSRLTILTGQHHYVGANLPTDEGIR